MATIQLVYFIMELLATLATEKHQITLSAISNLDATSGKSIVGAQWIAIQEINNNSQILPNYTLHLQGK